MEEKRNETRTTYRVRFWYWHQEITITGITADELVQSIFFPNSFEDVQFEREAYLDGEGGPFPVLVTLNSPDVLSICHLKRDDHDSIDVNFGEKNGCSELTVDYWILEEETQKA